MKNNLSPKDPWLAVWLSTIYPGFGQIYGASFLKGIIFIIIYTLLMFGALGSFLWLILGNPRFNLILVVVIGISALGFSIYNFFNAFYTAKYYNEKHQTFLPERKKQPFLAIFLSSFIPGLGQIYNRQWMKGISLFFLLSITTFLAKYVAGQFISELIEKGFLLWILNDAYSRAAKINNENPNIFSIFGNENVVKIVMLWIIIPLIFSGIIFFSGHFFLRAYKIPVNSMAPTLVVGDRVIVDIWSYKFKNPERGDLVTFQYPLDPKKDFVKRVIGLPGDKLIIKNGNIFVNDKLIDTLEIPKTRVYLNRDDWEYGKTDQVIEVPKDSYFVLGDNSAQSSDSRYWGFVSRQYIKGKVISIWWPRHRSQKLK